MSDIIRIDNHGQLITATDYWGSEAELVGKLFASANAGAIRLLVPRQHRAAINDMRTAKHCVLSRGPWPAGRTADGVEILFEDGTDDPFSLHLTPASFAGLPAEPGPDHEWVLTVWDNKKGRPHKCLERRCYWRRVPQLPWLKPWKLDTTPPEVN